MSATFWSRTLMPSPPGGPAWRSGRRIGPWHHNSLARAKTIATLVRGARHRAGQQESRTELGPLGVWRPRSSAHTTTWTNFPSHFSTSAAAGAATGPAWPRRLAGAGRTSEFTFIITSIALHAKFKLIQLGCSFGPLPLAHLRLYPATSLPGCELKPVHRG